MQHTQTKVEKDLTPTLTVLGTVLATGRLSRLSALKGHVLMRKKADVTLQILQAERKKSAACVGEGEDGLRRERKYEDKQK